MNALKKHWAALSILSLLLIIVVLLGIVLAPAAPPPKQIVGTYTTGQAAYITFWEDTYSFIRDGTYYKYGRYQLLEEGEISFVSQHIFRLSPAQGESREIMLLDGIIYELDPDGHYVTYQKYSEVPALYGAPETGAAPASP